MKAPQQHGKPNDTHAKVKPGNKMLGLANILTNRQMKRISRSDLFLDQAACGMRQIKYDATNIDGDHSGAWRAVLRDDDGSMFASAWADYHGVETQSCCIYDCTARLIVIFLIPPSISGLIMRVKSHSDLEVACNLCKTLVICTSPFSATLLVKCPCVLFKKINWSILSFNIKSSVV